MASADNTFISIGTIAPVISSVCAVIDIYFVLTFFKKNRENVINDEVISVKLRWFKFVFNDSSIQKIHGQVIEIIGLTKAYFDELNKKQQIITNADDQFLRDLKRTIRNITDQSFDNLKFIYELLHQALLKEIDDLEEAALKIALSYGDTVSDISKQIIKLVFDFEKQIFSIIYKWEETTVKSKKLNFFSFTKNKSA